MAGARWIAQVLAVQRRLRETRLILAAVAVAHCVLSKPFEVICWALFGRPECLYGFGLGDFWRRLENRHRGVRRQFTYPNIYLTDPLLKLNSTHLI